MAKDFELLAPCYVARQEGVITCMGELARMRKYFPAAVEGAGMVALPWYEGIEQLMESVNLHPFEDAAGYMPTGHRLSIPGVHIRLEEGSVVARRERISLTRH
ncbi:hypothetical protein FA274_30280 [Pseudomonas aeruginosa]|uniref:hypothetical protein n=1 Tax=Pseudomonas TaxID=286 RepID=UPI000FF03931|nr:hypothetical protein [Pseudomonas aeruginosa]MCO2870909.1 hypothetical protein [Pseudomonas aeruginosa]MDI4207297.1 hypothetical protein [Pseudomonas aeruginosa]MDV6628683.1 hypothetical protein [Pseudomonas aeruginosa]RPO29092.1 hypothetical protein IPC1221_06905 [Pseudomonas aeruginosa]HBP6838657.1 hypothetical protein [Pseudomonas aeruginosa]